jgi:PAS domain S-box-containing protein
MAEKPSYEELEEKLASLTRENRGLSMMLKAVETIPLSRNFEESARHIYGICKTLIGATCGYLALLTEDGLQNKVLFLDNGGLPCDVDPDLPMPIRGLWGVAYETGEVEYENDFSRCEWVRFMPSGHVQLQNVMFAPLNFGRETVGVMGLANKPVGFTEYDKDVAKLFGDIAALALKHTRSLEMLEERDKFSANLLAKSPNPILVINPDRSVRFVNQAFEKLTGFTANEIIGLKDPYPWWPDEAIHATQADFDKAVVHGAEKIEKLFKKKTGEAFSVEITLKPAFKGDKLEYYLANWVDISERKRAEIALRKSEAHMKSIFSAVPTGIGVIRDRIFMQVNEKFCEMVGCSEDELIGQNSRMVYPSDEEFEKVGREKYAQIMETGTGTIETVLRCKDGTIINVLLSSTPIEMNDLSAGVTFTVQDITEIKITGAALKKSESKYRAMMETIKDPVYISSEDYRVQYMNPAMIERIGKDGTGEYCYKALHDFEEKCLWCDKELIAREGHGTKDIVSPKDNRSYSVSSAGLNNDDGSTSKISVFRDTTDFKILQDRLLQAQKMESIGNITGGIAHDFNNILFPIVGMSELLLEDLSPDSLEYQNVQQILKAGERGSDLVSQILVFSRQSEHKMMPVRVQQIIKEVLKLSRSTIPSNIELSQFIQGDCGFVMADAIQLHQVAMNLITNAYHAVEQKGGTISVRLKEITLAHDDPTNASLKPGGYVMLTVSDTGYGIDPAVIDKIFDPYFTTKERKKGTGLGLAVVFGIVKEHGGDVRVYSELENGTTFNVYLPLLEELPRMVSVEGPEIALGGTERILLVDDEVTVLKVEKMILERFGYEVECRNSSVGALGVFGANPKSFDLVITDMAMPKMTGDQLAEQLISIRPDIPIILLTGFSERMNKEIAERIGIKGFLLKPVPKSNLARLVRKLLDEAKGEGT